LLMLLNMRYSSIRQRLRAIVEIEVMFYFRAKIRSKKTSRFGVVQKHKKALELISVKIC